MSNAVNILVGRLGWTPELKFFDQKLPQCTLRIAENRRGRNEKEEWTTVVLWHDIEVWGPLAERAASVLRKGSLGTFFYRINYSDRYLVDNAGQKYKASVPKFTLISFEALCDFGKSRDGVDNGQAGHGPEYYAGCPPS